MVAPNTRPKRTPAKPGRIDFTVGEFAKLVEDQGVYVKVTPAILCPNRNKLEGTDHDLNCTVCFGNEAVDLDSQAYEDWAFIQGIKLKLDWAIQGIFNVKDATMTIKGGRRLWYYDKVEILDHSSIFNEIVERTGTTDKLRYNAQPTAAQTPFHLIDSDGTEYALTTDFTISGQTLTWVTTGPPEGTLYSIQYPILPVYRVLELLHENRYYYQSDRLPDKQPVHLPQQCVLRWDYLSKNSGMNEAYPKE